MNGAGVKPGRGREHAVVNNPYASADLDWFTKKAVNLPPNGYRDLFADPSPNGFLRRPTTGFRYFILLLDVTTRTVQYAIVNPSNVPAGLGALLPNLPNTIPQATVDSVIGLRLPK